MNFIITGSEIEKDQCEELFNVAKFMNINIKNYCSKMDIFQTAFLLKKSSFVIGGDSGILHLANSVDIPVIGFFGPTNSNTLVRQIKIIFLFMTKNVNVNTLKLMMVAIV